MVYPINAGKNALKLYHFHPYMYPAGSAMATEWQRFIGEIGTASAIWPSPEGPIELRIHDETTPSGLPIGGAQGAPGIPGPMGPKPRHVWQDTLLGFENPNGTYGPYVDLQGPPGVQGTPGDVGPAGPTGPTPTPVWNGTTLEWQDAEGNVLAGPVDLKGPAGDNGVNGLDGTLVWMSSHPTFSGVQVLHIVPAGSPAGTLPQTYNIGMHEVQDFEYFPAEKKLQITTYDNYEFEVVLDFVRMDEVALALANYMTTTAHAATLENVYANDGVTVLFKAH